MKIKYKNHVGKWLEVSIDQAVRDKLTPSAYSYDGQIERLQEQINLQQEMLAKLIELIFNGKTYREQTEEQAVRELLGYYYEVEE